MSADKTRTQEKNLPEENVQISDRFGVTYLSSPTYYVVVENYRRNY